MTHSSQAVMSAFHRWQRIYSNLVLDIT